MQIIRLIYASIARPDLAYDDLKRIRRTAIDRNIEAGLTGILCYSGGAFLQAIEGKRLPVNKLYNQIVQDPRHSNCEILSCSEIETRSFIEWSMKLISWEEAYTPQRRALVLRHSGLSTFEPWTMTAKQAYGFLVDLAELERRKDLTGLRDLSDMHAN